MNGRELRDWSGLSPRQNESSVRYIQQGISASKEQNSIVPGLSPLAFGKIGSIATSTSVAGSYKQGKVVHFGHRLDARARFAPFLGR
jgi:hypothetical protein